MLVQTMYQTMVSPLPVAIPQYSTPRIYFDQKRAQSERKLATDNKRSYPRFKPSKQTKPCFMDEHIKPFSENPSPNKYHPNSPKSSKGKSKKRVRAVSQKNLQKLNKNTYIQQIQNQEKLRKRPGVGKYDLTTLTDFKLGKEKKGVPAVKISAMDDIVYLSGTIPGPGNYNPRDEVKKVEPNCTDHHFYVTKHIKEEERLKRSVSAKVGPSTYQAVSADTFESTAVSKAKPISRWLHGEIDIRKGTTKNCKQPSPASYNTLDRWAEFRAPKAKEFGKLHALAQISKPAPPSIYY